MDVLRDRDRLRGFIDVIVSSLDDDVAGSDIAARNYLSRYHFDRLVSGAIRESPAAFRRRLLLERAAWQMRERGTTITAAALGAGYQSPEAFTRTFARAYGLTPGRFRRNGRSYHLEAPNGIHFHPPGGIAVPADGNRRTHMDMVDRLVGHDIWFTTQLLDRAAQLPAEELDRPLPEAWTWGGDEPPTLRAVLNEMVANKENWSAALTGRDAPPAAGDGIEDLQRRYERAGAEFAGLVRGIRDRGQWDAGFVDALCDPPESFTYGGMLAHVATFSAIRRMMAIVAFRELGVTDIGLGDPIEWERSLA
ncbi:MAG TPA: AraC family transcriptional regulator [Chloroflexota bacterium]|nr:AraC family transcriptional regulator [Chloroflexota bacterium]